MDGRQMEKGNSKQERLVPRYEIVNQLKLMRKSQNVTQEELAELVGTQKSNISRFESGRYNPSLDFLIKVADSLGQELQIILKGQLWTEEEETWQRRQ